MAFESYATNLVAGDTNGMLDVFLVDLETADIVRASVTDNGSEISPCQEDPSGGGCWYPTGAQTPGYRPALSGDGQYVAFVSDAYHVVPGDTNWAPDIFLYDRTAQRTVERVSISTGGAQGNWTSDEPSLSRDGRFVAYSSQASNLVAGDSNGTSDVFVRDRSAGTTTRASITDSDGQGNGSSARPSVSDDGRYVAFESAARNLRAVNPDSNTVLDVYVRDRNASTTYWASENWNASPRLGDSFAPDIAGSSSIVTFATYSSLWGADTNSAADIYEYNFVGGTSYSMLSYDEGRSRGNGSSDSPSVSDTGVYAAYSTRATNLFPASDTNGVADIATHQWADVYSPASVDRKTAARPRGPRGAPSTRHPGACGGARAYPRIHWHKQTRTVSRNARTVRRVVRVRHRHREPSRRNLASSGLESRAAAVCLVRPQTQPNSSALKLAARIALGVTAAYVLARVLARIERRMAGCGLPLYHYSSSEGAGGIFAERRIFASASNGIYPAGAYATVIAPITPGYTQTTLAEHLFGFIKPVTHWVMLCTARNLAFRQIHTIQPAAPAESVDYYVRPAPAGTPVTIIPEAWGVNPMP